MFLRHINKQWCDNFNIFRKLKRNALRGTYIYRTKFCRRNVLNLHERGMFESIFPENSTNEIVQLLNRKPQHVYAGFDPTASSLHVGNLLILMNLLHWQRAGHNVIALIGCATAQIGDPSGHNKDREEQDGGVVRERARHIQKNIENIFNNHEKYFWSKNPDPSPLPPIKVVDNEEWYKDVKVIDFLSKVGRNFRMGTMLLKDSVNKRIKSEGGMNFAEFTYQIFQANDWLHLFKTYDCKFQIGGKDQMGNIVAGHNLISRVVDQPVYGLTLPLVTNDAGDKFGKSLPNAVWLDKNLTSAFDFYQFFVRTEDSKVEHLLKLFTFLPLDQIAHIMEKQLKNPEQRIAQTKLAEEITVLVHGEGGLKAAQTASSILYAKDLETIGSIPAEHLINLEGVTIVELPWKAGYSVLEFAMDIPCFLSKSDARRIMDAGGFYINMQKVKNIDEVLSQSVHVLPNNITLARVGKKNYWIVKWTS
ncbi:tyrosine--tRNA ligase, mitochondrial isoform X1 [Planococcus citri]|uniref:tyrosine--tRNA ligase, mitochondrial isoform X1 n=2 Tax=Planococcus citri TaxID=170843 RepID=UPI0031F9D9B3